MVCTDSVLERWLSRDVTVAKKEVPQTESRVIRVHGHRWTLTGWPPTPAMLRHIAECGHQNLVDLSSVTVVEPLSVLRSLAATCRVCSMFVSERFAENAVLAEELDAWCAESPASDSSTENEEMLCAFEGPHPRNACSSSWQICERDRLCCCFCAEGEDRPSTKFRASNM